MASLKVIGLLCAICIFPLRFISAETQVELTSPVHPVTVGGILAIKCQVWKMQDGYKIDLLRVLENGDTDPLTVRGNYLVQSSFGQRGFFAKRSFSDGSMVLFLTAIDILPTDQGSYLCKVYTDVHGNTAEITRDTINIEIYTFPSHSYPSCGTIPNTNIIQGSEKLTLRCTSEKGFPVAELNWSCTKNDVHFEIHDSQNEDSVSSELTVTVDGAHNGAVFVCQLTSPGFPDRVRSCTYGPFTVLSKAGDYDVVLSNRPGFNTLQPKPNQNEDTFKATKCNVSCATEDPYIILYWAVACAGSSILMFIFLTTTILYCCKYQTISSEVITAQNSFTSCDGSEPVYVSLQRRQLPERNSMFMSVEDPNNPGNKVLMPREVFDEFYRSLSLKKREHSH